MNLKKILLSVGILLLFVLALPLIAQTGCDESPEDPTLVLALLGAVGAVLAGLWAVRARRES